jgi:hypothetical protein
MTQIDHVNGRVERYDEVGRLFIDASFRWADQLLIVFREDEVLAWYPEGSWTAVIFGVDES